MENMPGAAHLLAGQTSIDDVLREKYDLTPQLPLHWAAFETNPPGRRRDAAGSAPRLQHDRLGAVLQRLRSSFSVKSSTITSDSEAHAGHG